ncbi:MAG: type II toxin-antitoxin system HipA family toxin [Nitrospirae bacterium]|nr:type II toxin-antitoxin system HipA family toxin [Nitrospirota bacterium]MBI3352391.1 type II toxin-antitoxin system HipA family toxin [Nitrospirota bacterium]
MDKEALVYVDLDGVPRLVGRLWSRVRKRKESATFEYDQAWLEHPERFSLEPALKLGPGPFHTPTDTPMFGAIGDSAPDRWGRALMRRMERRRAEREGGAPRTLQEIDYLLLVDDEARQGALRFAEREGGPFLREEGVKRIPPLVELPKLLSAAEHVVEEKDTDEDLRLLFAPGSSLGGARPKASVREKDGHLAIAKFPRRDDEINTVMWEAVALTLAKKAGIAVPERRVENVGNKPVLLLRRFDRDGARRIPFLSAMSMLGSKDNETRSYLEIVDALRQHGAAPKADMEALWRRMVFNILISNTDDHLRNHGFLYEGPDGWRLSPAYDLNPQPTDIKPRILTTAVNEDDNTASLALAMEVAGYFELDATKAREIAAQVGNAVSKWRDEAARYGLTKGEINRMASAFEHQDLKAALDGQ